MRRRRRVRCTRGTTTAAKELVYKLSTMVHTVELQALLAAAKVLDGGDERAASGDDDCVGNWQCHPDVLLQLAAALRASRAAGAKVQQQSEQTLLLGCWLLDAGCWRLDAGGWRLADGYWLLDAGCSCWLLAVGV